jgi:hypothetical protein
MFEKFGFSIYDVFAVRKRVDFFVMDFVSSKHLEYCKSLVLFSDKRFVFGLSSDAYQDSIVGRPPVVRNFMKHFCIDGYFLSSVFVRLLYAAIVV